MTEGGAEVEVGRPAGVILFTTSLCHPAGECSGHFTARAFTLYFLARADVDALFDFYCEF